VNYSKAKRWYRIRSALVIYGTALITTVSTAILCGWTIATYNGGGSSARGGIFAVFLAFIFLVFVSPVLVVLMLRAMFSGSAVSNYFKARVKKKVERSKVSGRIKSLRKFN